MKFVDLFSGGGGFTYGLLRAGHICIAHAEISPYANAIFENRFSNLQNLGDVSQLQNLPFCDLVVGSSLCQDLSKASTNSGQFWVRSKRSSWTQRSHIGTMTAHEHKDHHTLIETTQGFVRKLLENEAEALMSWPKDSTLAEIPWRRRYEVLGNGVVSNIAYEIGKNLQGFSQC